MSDDQDHVEDPDHEDPDHIEAADQLPGRLGRLAAELAGHLPTPDFRLQTLFGSGRADEPSRADRTEPIAVVDALDPGPTASGTRTRWANLAIAAAFALLVGSAVYLGTRSGTGSPVQTAADAADDASTQALTGRPAASDDNEATGAAASSTGDGSGDRGVTVGEPPAGHDESDEPSGQPDEGGEQHPFSDPEWAEELEDLGAEHRAWIECAAGAVEGWLESWSDGHGHDDDGDGDDDDGGEDPDAAKPDVAAECGEPPFPFGGEGFVWPDMVLPDLDLPDLDGSDICETVEDGDAVTVTCHWPPCLTGGGDDSGTQADRCPPFELMPWLEQLLPGGWPDEAPFDEWPDDFEFRFDLEWDRGELERHLEELLPEGWQDHLDDLEELEERFGELDERFGGPRAGRLDPDHGTEEA